MEDSSIEVPVAEKLCKLCSEMLWNRGLEKRAHHLSIEELTNSTRCPLCRMFCSAMEGGQRLIEQPDQSFVSVGWPQKFREALKGSAITIQPLSFHLHFSEQVPFRFLQPSTGGVGNRRQGRPVGVIYEEGSCKYFGYVQIYKVPTLTIPLQTWKKFRIEPSGHSKIPLSMKDSPSLKGGLQSVAALTRPAHRLKDHACPKESST